VDSNGNFYGTTVIGGPSNDGTVFEIVRGSGTITTLASFNGTNGANPYAGLTLDASGNLYGTTSLNGTVFEIAKGSSTITTLASFRNAANGDDPMGGVTLDASGNLYGTTYDRGASNDGTVFEIAKGSGTITTLASFNGTNGANSYAGVTVDSNGNFYGTTVIGGPSNDGTVFEIVRGSGTITTLASFNGSTGGSEAGLTLDASGNLYGTTYGGGPSGDGTVFEIARGTGIITTLASFNGANGATPKSGVTLDASGNLYGTTDRGGAGNVGTVFEIAKGSSTITALTSFNRTNGAHPDGGVILDATGNLYGTAAEGGASGLGVVFELTANTAVSLSLTSGTSPSTFVQPLTFTVSVSGGVPDGQVVTLIDASNVGAVVATGTLVGGSATLLIPGGTLSAGTHQLIAVYAGDTTHAASESAPLLQTILPATYRPTRSP
jgi:uncharacterized repeat protein (TIGR03803 family)